jgi:hypothetical protein
VDTTPAARLIRTELAACRPAGIDPIVLPRSPGSWPGYVLTGDPLHLAAGGFGLGHGDGAHAPNEYYLIESTDSKLEGMDGAVRSYVELLYAIAT